MIRFLFKQPQPKRFSFKPRYYDERREYLESRKAAIRRELDADSEYSADGYRSRISTAWRSNQRRKASSRSNRNVLLIAAILTAIAYLLFYA